MRTSTRLAALASLVVLAGGALAPATAAPPRADRATTSTGTTSGGHVTVQAGEITYTLHRSANPTADEQDAYARITDAVDRAVSRYNRLTDIPKVLNVYYAPGVPTAEGNINGDLRFGSNRGFMQEGTALHEISHTIGIGQSGGWYDLCGSGQWAGQRATALLEQWDGAGARINCGGGHIWPYGLNYSNEYNEQNFDRHALLMQAMVDDGM